MRAIWIALGGLTFAVSGVSFAGTYPPGAYVRTAEGVLIGPARDAEEAGAVCAAMRSRGAVCAVLSVGTDGVIPGSALPPPVVKSAPAGIEAPKAKFALPPPPPPAPPVVQQIAALAPLPKPVAPPPMAPPGTPLPQAVPVIVPLPTIPASPPETPAAAVPLPKPPAPASERPLRPANLTGTTGIAVSLAERRLYLFEGESVIGTWPVAVGKASTPSPTGATEIIRKRTNPTWIPTAQMRARDPRLPTMVPPGPDNPLGQHALDLAWDAYRIHGTNAPRSVGNAVSSGCFRMLPAHISELFQKVGVGTRVVVTAQSLPRAPSN